MAPRGLRPSSAPPRAARATGAAVPALRAAALSDAAVSALSAAALTDADVAALRAAAGRFGAVAAAEKSDRLARCAACALTDASVLLEYHDALLFLLAYPETPALAGAARRELARVAAAAAALAGGTTRARRTFAGSGLPGSTTTATFSLDIARWLVARHPGRAVLDGFADGAAAVAETLIVALPALEAETVAAGADDAMALVASLAGERARPLDWLVATIDGLQAADAVRAHLFDALRPYVALTADAGALSRSFARGLAQPTFFHTDLERGADVRALIATPLPDPRKTSSRERRDLVDVARATLALLARETDPVTWPAVDGVRWFDLGRGMAIALYPMHQARRFALDSHVGFLLFKNGLPAAYGGGWPFLGGCRIGVNVFPAYRGGESALLFAQVLRTYAQRYRVARFIVEPYQFGAGNREGLQSGALWFYWRLGFRPVDARAAALGTAEFARMAADRGYRPPLPTMRKLTRDDLALVVDPERAAAIEPEPARLAHAVSAWIARVHRGDRARAQAAALAAVTAALGIANRKNWRPDEEAALRTLAPLFAALPDLGRWSVRDKADAVALIRAKGAPDDAAWFVRLGRHRRLATALSALAATVD